MAYRVSTAVTETHKRRLLQQRILIVHGFFIFVALLIVARLLDLQLVRGDEYRSIAQAQHYGGVKLPAKRGDIFGLDSKTGERNILATNTTLDLVYVDPLITTNPTQVAETLSDILLTSQDHQICSAGGDDCPRELIPFYASAYDPLTQYSLLHTGALLEPLPVTGVPPPQLLKLPDFVEARRLFARDIERRISQKRVTFVPLKYSATKTQMATVEDLHIAGIAVSSGSELVSADPEEVPQSMLGSISHLLGKALDMDPGKVEDLLVSRPLRYVPIMRRLPPELSLKIKETQLQFYKDAVAKNRASKPRGEAAQEVDYPLRSVALIAEHWRYYPDSTIASHVIGFLNTNQEPQYGIERTFNVQLRGQEGLINAVSDPQGGQILTADETVVRPKDGDSVVLTIDRTIQKEVERVLNDAVQHYKADSGQAIVMDPYTGRILAMANAPLFDSNNYAQVYAKEPLEVDENRRKQIVVEIYNPESQARVVKAYIDDVFTASGRTLLSDKTRQALTDLEKQYDIHDLTRYFLFIGPNLQLEIFPTDKPNLWLKYKNSIGVGAYLNRAVQEIYEPGSVMKPITMAIAIDQGEVQPSDTYDDNGPVQVDEYKIDNNDNKHYGHVTMTNCLEFSINTCMTSISFKLGPKLLERSLARFGFGRITGVELEDELPGEVKPWREWSRSLLATTAFGQGLTATPLQMITAWSALANGGRLPRPTIIDSIVHPDGSVETTPPHAMDQIITQAASDTITAMLVSSATKGFAKSGKVPGYRIAGKTGTSQIAGPGGKYTSGTGSTFATYAGFAPVTHPKFVVLVKLDRPKNTLHGAVAAAPVFKDIAAFLFKYYGIPPDEK